MMTTTAVKWKHFTEEQARFIQIMANRVWQEIGYDCLQAIESVGEAKKGRATMKQAEVIEVVLDANRMEDEVKRELRSLPTKADVIQPVLDVLQRHHPPTAKTREFDRIMKAAFPFKVYGW